MSEKPDNAQLVSLIKDSAVQIAKNAEHLVRSFELQSKTLEMVSKLEKRVKFLEEMVLSSGPDASERDA